MKVELVAPPYGNDLMVVNCARVSFNKWHKDFEENDTKLINYLAREGHWMPFAHPRISLRMHVPIFIARQCQKHQIGFEWSEVSRRYVDDPPEFFVPNEWRSRPEGSVKQGSGSDKVTELKTLYGAEVGPEDLWGDLDNKWHPTLHYQLLMDTCKWFYEDLLKSGVAPEQARMVLPQSMYTTWIWTGSLAAWARAYKQRSDKHAQLEIQELAALWDKIIAPLFPVSWKALTC